MQWQTRKKEEKKERNRWETVAFNLHDLFFLLFFSLDESQNALAIYAAKPYKVPFDLQKLMWHKVGHSTCCFNDPD